MTSLTFTSLVVAAILVSTASAQVGISSCCRRFLGTQIHRDLLKSYYREDPSMCRLHAVVFHTVGDKRICSDPVTMWTQNSMDYLDRKNYQKQRTTLHQIGN